MEEQLILADLQDSQNLIALCEFVSEVADEMYACEC